MGALVALMLTGFIVVGIYKFFTQSDARRNFLAECAEAPFESAFVFLWVACGLTFFWGVFVPPLGTIKIMILGTRRELWAVAGIASLAGFVLMGLYTWLKTPRYPK